MKKIFKFLLFLLPWFLSSLFMKNVNFYKSLTLPFFAPPPILFAIVWPILYLLIAISIYKISKIACSKEYKYFLIANYIFNQSFIFLFFNLKSIILGTLSSILSLITAIFLFLETKKIDKKTSYLLIPYLIWLIFASILSISILFLN